MWNCDAIEQDLYRDNNVDGDGNENVTKQDRSKTFRKERQVLRAPNVRASSRRSKSCQMLLFFFLVVLHEYSFKKNQSRSSVKLVVFIALKSTLFVLAPAPSHFCYPASSSFSGRRYATFPFSDCQAATDTFPEISAGIASW